MGLGHVSLHFGLFSSWMVKVRKQVHQQRLQGQGHDHAEVSRSQYSGRNTEVTVSGTQGPHVSGLLEHLHTAGTLHESVELRRRRDLCAAYLLQESLRSPQCSAHQPLLANGYVRLSAILLRHSRHMQSPWRNCNQIFLTMTLYTSVSQRFCLCGLRPPIPYTAKRCLRSLVSLLAEVRTRRVFTSETEVVVKHSLTIKGIERADWVASLLASSPRQAAPSASAQPGPYGLPGPYSRSRPPFSPLSWS